LLRPGVEACVADTPKLSKATSHAQDTLVLKLLASPGKFRAQIFFNDSAISTELMVYILFPYSLLLHVGIAGGVATLDCAAECGMETFKFKPAMRVQPGTWNISTFFIPTLEPQRVH
jgi:hypothetical protein